MSVTCHHYHTSSRYSRSPLSLYKAIKAIINSYDMITLTEVQSDARILRLMRILGWELSQDNRGNGRDECAILSRKNKWERGFAESWQLTKGESSIRNQPVWAYCRFFEHKKTQKSFYVVVFHNVQSDVDPELNNEANHTLAKRLEELGSRVQILAAGDHNNDWNLIHVRWYYRRIFRKKFHFTWNMDTRRPNLGTYNDKVIDWSITTLRVAWAKVHKLNNSSDHRAYSEKLVFPE